MGKVKLEKKKLQSEHQPQMRVRVTRGQGKNTRMKERQR